MGLPHNTPAILKAAGLKVVEHSGWKTRGRPGGMTPVGVLCHHTATGPNSKDSSVTNLLIRGRSDLAGPLCNLGLDRDGRVHIIAAGRANHAGRAKASGSMAAQSSGNAVYIGIEAFNSGTGEKWNKTQYDAYVLLCAVLCLKVTGNSVNTVRAHKETSVTGKIDPAGPTPYEGSFDMGKFRDRVAAKMKALSGPAPAPKPKPVTSHTRWAVRATGVHETKGGKKLRDLQPGESFKVIDGSGHGNNGWIETTHHNWVVGKDTSTTAPDAPASKARLSVMTHNVWNGRNWAKDVLPTLNDILEDHKPDVPCLQECYKAPDLVGKVPGYAYRYQGHGYPPKTEGYVEERADNLILVRDGVSVKATEAYEMTKSWAGPKAGVMHDPRVFRRVTVNKDGQNFRVVNVHGPFTAAARKEFLTWARAEFEKLAALGDPVVFIGDWNFKYAELVEAMGPLAAVDGAAPDMAVYANCRKTGSKNLGKQGSDTHDCKIFEFEA